MKSTISLLDESKTLLLALSSCCLDSQQSNRTNDFCETNEHSKNDEDDDDEDEDEDDDDEDDDDDDDESKD
ncbi:hypothetical protein M0804_001838 [Polistes exclamans]|nr:hypothetical protein M0804_001838 [Polistes exclamans]